MRNSFILLVAALSFACCVGSSSGSARNVWDSPFRQENAFQKGLTALKDNHFEEALEAFTAAEQEHPEDARVRTFRGIALVQLGKTTEAVAEYQEAIRLDPKYEAAYRNFGFLLWTQRQFDHAREILIRAIALSPDDAFAHYYLGRVQLDVRQYSDALRELKLSGLSTPADPDLLLQVATGYEALGEQEEAKKILGQLSALVLSGSQTAQVASLLLAIEEYETAIAVLQKASSRQLANADYWAQFDLALAYLMSGNYEKALQQSKSYLELGRADQLTPAELDSAYSLIGITHARLGHGDLSVEALRLAATLDPQEEGWMNLSRELMELSRFPQAISAVQQGIAANPKSYALQLRLGAAHLAAGQYKEAEKAFCILVDAGDPLPTSYVGLAQVLLREGRAEDAVTVLSAAEQKIGENFLLSYFLGLSFDRAGKRMEGLAAFKIAVHLDPKSPEAHLGLGKTELALGHLNESISELQETLRLNPGNPQARRLLSQAYLRAGDAASAIKYPEPIDEKQPIPEGELLGDFLLPPWQTPADN